MNLSVSRTSLGRVPLVASGTTQAGAVVIAWQPGVADPANEYAESAWLDGSSLSRTRLDLVDMSLTLRLYGSSESAVRAQLADWTQALRQFSYTITDNFTGGSTVYSCCPAKVTPDFDGYQLSLGRLVVACSIPRQP